MAPAPRRSSIAGRKLPSGQRSPVGMIPTAPPPAISRLTRATAAALRRQPAITGLPPPARDSREPFGDGSMSLDPAGIARRLAGDRLSCPPPARRGSANAAPTRSAAACAASRSPSGKG